MSDPARVDELADLSLLQANISTTHYNLSKPNAYSQCSGVLRPHSTWVVNRVSSAISTITDYTVSGALFNLVQWVLSHTSITTSCGTIRLKAIGAVEVYTSFAATEKKMHCLFNHIINLIKFQHANYLIKGSQFIELPLISWLSAITAMCTYPSQATVYNASHSFSL